MIEILAPAGDITSAYAAINSGADAIYLGMTAFSARSSAKNFGVAELTSLASYAHAFGVKIYVAMNTLVKQSEVSDFIKNIVAVWNAGADAVIMQDLYLGKYVKSRCPQIVLHLSTQAGVNNVYGAKLAKKFGFDRVILARETKLEDIKKITKVIETETFIQGALCTCFSGQCYFSSFVGGNSGNRGKCKQPCRKRYSIDRKGYETPEYRLSLADLSVGDKIEELIEAGVSSFKIEGRLRRPEYVAAAVSYYKNILSGKANEKDLSALKRTYNRGNYTKGLAFGQDKSFISHAVQGHVGEFCGIVKNLNGKSVCITQIKCSAGDGFKILRDGKEIGGAAYGGECRDGFILSSSTRLKNGDKVFITTDANLNKSLLEKTRKIKVDISLYFESGKKPKAVICGREYEADFVLQPAENRPLDVKDIKNCFAKTDTYPFEICYGEIVVDENIFSPLSSLNAFRRFVYAEFWKAISSTNRAEISQLDVIEYYANPANTLKTAGIVSNLDNFDKDILIYKPNDYSEINDKTCSEINGEKFLYVPAYAGDTELEIIKSAAKYFDGIYSEGYFGAELCADLNMPLFAGTGFNITNAVALSEVGAKYVALSKELTIKEAQQIAGENCFYLTAGGIKLMDLIYCPFEKTCKVCDKRNCYTLRDENSRAFPLRRYALNGCKFEIYNCVQLKCAPHKMNALCDFTCGKNSADSSNYTKGHTENGVL